MPSSPRSQAAAYFLLPLAAACWAGNHIFARAVGGHAPPATLSLARWVIVVLLVSVVAGPRIYRDWPTLRQNVGILALLGIVGAGFFGTLQYVALQYTTALNMGVVGSIAPAFIVAASWLLFRERLSALQLFGVTVSLAGVLVIVSRLDAARLSNLSFNSGDLIILANMVLWAIYSACLRLRPQVHPMSFLFAVSMFALLVNIPFALWEYAINFRLQHDLLTGAAIGYAAMFTTILAYVAWNRGIDIVGAPRASAFLHTIPLFSAVLATTILGETLELYHIVGFALILAGVTWAARPTAKQRQADAVAR